jgi:hypothetical protein
MDYLINQWKKLLLHTRILSIGVVLTFSFIILLIIGPTLKGDNNFDDPEPPHGAYWLKITDESVYNNGTISFTIICIFESYGGVPTPEYDLFQVIEVFICTEDDLLEFNDTLGDIQAIESIIVLRGDFFLKAYEELEILFYTNFPLDLGLKLYTGVFTKHGSAIGRWDRYTTVVEA